MDNPERGGLKVKAPGRIYNYGAGVLQSFRGLSLEQHREGRNCFQYIYAILADI
jgi:hypothetical protein